MMRLSHKLWLRQNLKAKPQYQYTVCVKGLLPTTWQPPPLTGAGGRASQTNGNVTLWRLNTNTHICLHMGHKRRHTTHWIMLHGVGCIISADQYIHDFFSHLEIHLTVKGRGCSQVHTHFDFQSSFRDHFSRFQTDRWLKWSSYLSATTDRRSSVRVCTPVCVCMCNRC